MDLFSQHINKAENTLSGVVERITYHNAETGFCVLQLTPDGTSDRITVIGSITEINKGELLSVKGEWIVDKKWGPQFKADELQTTTPATIIGIEKYLGSGLIKGIGPQMAARLVGAFGDQVFEIIEQNPKRMLEVDGIGAARLEMIANAWSQQKAIRTIMVFLHSHGVTTTRAFRIFQKYGQDSIRMISEDPYCLARDIRGFGFKLADQVAHNLKIASDSPVRAAAGVEFVLNELTSFGHCAFGEDELITKAAELLNVKDEIVQGAVATGVNNGRLVRVVQPGSDLETGSDLIALAAIREAEQHLAADLAQLARQNSQPATSGHEKSISLVEQETGLNLADAQKEAIKLALINKVLVITGGPGVGKTTLLNAIIKILQRQGQKIVACAPTGRAARRLSDSTGLQARTIHRVLEFLPATGSFRHDHNNPLSGDVFVIDEFSMVDVLLARQLVRAIPASAKVLIVGDVDQLPSVGPGCVLADIISAKIVPVAKLTTVFRQAAQSAIIVNAHLINSGRLPDLSAHNNKNQLSDFYFIERNEPMEISDLLVKLVKDRLPARFGLDARRDIQVLTPMIRGILGTRALNERLQTALNPIGQEIEHAGWHWRVGDKVMQVVNNYDKDIFNGDGGTIETINCEEQALTVRYENRLVEYEQRELDELVFSYAISIHKSQGSEYPAVIIPVHTQHYVLLQRNLLYTGVTRGRKLVVLVGSRRAAEIAVGRVESRQRITTLKTLLRNLSTG